MPIYSRYISSLSGSGIQSINGSVIAAQQIVGTGDVNVNTVTGTGVTTISLSTPLSTFANTSLSNLVAPTAVNVPLLAALGSDTAPAYSFTGDTNTGIYLASADTLGLTTGGSERMRIDSSGNVGIGTTNPLETLTLFNQNPVIGQRWNLARADASSYVAGGVDSWFRTRDANINLGAYVRILDVNTNPGFPTTVRGGVISFGTVDGITGFSNNPAVERMRIDSAGNVGIGTTAPADKLHVVGSMPLIITNGTTDNAAKSGRLATTHYTVSEEPLALIGGSPFQTTNSVFIGGGYTSTNAATDIQFFTAANTTTTSGTQRMRITSAGNVGINVTSSPSQRLEVDGQVSFTSATGNSTNGNFRVIGTTQNQISIFDHYGSGTSAINGRVAAGTFASPVANGNAIDVFRLLGSSYDGSIHRQIAKIDFQTVGATSPTSAGGQLLFYTVPNGSTTIAERMRITDAGNVGIGTLTPGSKLEVVGTSGYAADLKAPAGSARILSTTGTNSTQFRLTNTAGNFYVALDSSTGSNFGSAYSANLWHDGNYPMRFATNNTVKMTLDAVGNLGLGSTTFGTSAEKALALANGVEPSTSVVNQIAMGSVDLTAGNTIPYIRSEGTGMTGAGITNTAVTHKIAIKVNGTVYYLLATTDGT